MNLSQNAVTERVYSRVRESYQYHLKDSLTKIQLDPCAKRLHEFLMTISTNVPISFSRDSGILVHKGYTINAVSAHPIEDVHESFAHKAHVEVSNLFDDSLQSIKNFAEFDIQFEKYKELYESYDSLFSFVNSHIAWADMDIVSYDYGYDQNISQQKYISLMLKALTLTLPNELTKSFKINFDQSTVIGITRTLNYEQQQNFAQYKTRKARYFSELDRIIFLGKML